MFVSYNEDSQNKCVQIFRTDTVWRLCKVKQHKAVITCNGKIIKTLSISVQATCILQPARAHIAADAGLRDTLKDSVSLRETDVYSDTV